MVSPLASSLKLKLVLTTMSLNHKRFTYSSRIVLLLLFVTEDFQLTSVKSFQKQRKEIEICMFTLLKHCVKDFMNAIDDVKRCHYEKVVYKRELSKETHK